MATQPQQARPWQPGQFKHTDRERWICVYPAYINSRKSVKEGRQLPKDKCVDNPMPLEIRDVLASCGLYIGVEKKVYPRELDHKDPKAVGRIRIQIKNEDGAPINDQLATRKDILNYICEMIPKLKSRQQSASSSQSQTQSQQGAKNQKKKGRKGK